MREIKNKIKINKKEYMNYYVFLPDSDNVQKICHYYCFCMG